MFEGRDNETEKFRFVLLHTRGYGFVCYIAQCRGADRTVIIQRAERGGCFVPGIYLLENLTSVSRAILHRRLLHNIVGEFLICSEKNTSILTKDLHIAHICNKWYKRNLNNIKRIQRVETILRAVVTLTCCHRPTLKKSKNLKRHCDNNVNYFETGGKVRCAS
ncbi:PREDICTED: uncharacterized protein LOC108551583 isoform X2 [Eufriesea mexicana]|uniref:uncharacterized protein LOC108551583 isoform X2 n=1 Tax=Eufriesea mexicana TaxID=516756 RepID=UPI00083BD552|nr:PREDICTED: uncharacterized protein LOC108551583 isoform X2 [Eufriesea mexicana]